MLLLLLLLLVLWLLLSWLLLSPITTSHLHDGPETPRLKIKCYDAPQTTENNTSYYLPPTKWTRKPLRIKSFPGPTHYQKRLQSLSLSFTIDWKLSNRRQNPSWPPKLPKIVPVTIFHLHNGPQTLQLKMKSLLPDNQK